ncbi:MAG: hypothetical protein AAFO80_11695 [Pseudomonadota bacterium]
MADNQKEPRPGQPSGRRRHPALDLRIPFFLPLWRRVATVAVLAIWTGIELIHGNPYWAMLSGGLGIYAAIEFFYRFNPDDFADKTDKTDKGGSNG